MRSQNTRPYGTGLWLALIAPSRKGGDSRTSWSTLTILALAVLALALQGLAAGVNIEFTDGSFQVAGIAPGREPAAGWQSVFAVYAADGEVPPMLGAYRVTSDGLLFTPRFPLASGVHYRAVFKGEGAPLERRFDGSKPLAAPAARVTQVYPTTDILPSNQLKLYLYFSAPMQRGEVWKHIRLLDDSGKKVDLAFLEIDQELWDPGNRRLTVLFDPGRIKRGVKPQMDTGSAIVEGRRYTLVVDKELRDANGSELAAAFHKEFRGGPALRTGIDLNDWRIAPPAAGTREALQIDFPAPLDFALVEHVIHVQSPAGEIAGSVSIDAHETRWRFTPSEPWRTGTLNLLIDMALEDLAGNRIGRPFDVDMINHPAERITAATATLPFEIR